MSENDLAIVYISIVLWSEHSFCVALKPGIILYSMNCFLLRENNIDCSLLFYLWYNLYDVHFREMAEVANFIDIFTLITALTKKIIQLKISQEEFLVLRVCVLLNAG